MPHSDETLRRVLDAVYDLHRHGDPLTFPARLVEVVAHAVPCDSAVLLSVGPGGGEVAFESWPRDHFAGLDAGEAARLHAAGHPFVEHCRRSRSASAFRLADLAPREAFERTDLYAKLYRFLGIEHQLLMALPGPGGRRRAVALNRRTEEFREDERAALEALWPHVALAERRHRKSLRSHAPAIADEWPVAIGVLLIDGAGTVTLCTEQARIWLAVYFESLPRGKRIELPAALAAWAGERLRSESQGRRLREPRPDPLIVARGDRCLVANLLVDHGKSQHLLRLEELELNAPPASLASLGLTPREGEVLAWVAQGKTNREVGLILGTSARTVQKHLEHVFQKIGVESRTAAILRAWAAARATSLAREGYSSQQSMLNSETIRPPSSVDR